MNAVGQGDRAAFEQLVDRHIDALYAFALRLCRDPSNAEDLVQETWLTVWLKADGYRPGAARVSTWMHRIAHNRFVDTYRRKHRDADLVAQVGVDGSFSGQSVESIGTTEAPTASVALPGNLQALSSRIDELPEQQRCAIALTYLQGFANKEVATIMGLNLRALESLLARAKRALTKTRT